ncbi:hypothetical protein AN416_09910 [Paraburkholderia caribensis]|nr:hypothetical protein AN416_09910 [Paraburkholderia caribensis]AUT51885.1 hypothetical protein C2L66_08485 [Paraburkholderia caribensis]
MSACSHTFFRSCAADRVVVAADNKATMRSARRNATTEVEPLAPSAGAAAFFIARSSLRRSQRTFVKEPIENQANRHY